MTLQEGCGSELGLTGSGLGLSGSESQEKKPASTKRKKQIRNPSLYLSIRRCFIIKIYLRYYSLFNFARQCYIKGTLRLGNSDYNWIQAFSKIRVRNPGLQSGLLGCKPAN